MSGTNSMVMAMPTAPHTALMTNFARSETRPNTTPATRAPAYVLQARMMRRAAATVGKTIDGGGAYHCQTKVVSVCLRSSRARSSCWYQHMRHCRLLPYKQGRP